MPKLRETGLEAEAQRDEANDVLEHRADSGEENRSFRSDVDQD
jgi:hypothetical protein